jgi:hypothetical protein
LKALNPFRQTKPSIPENRVSTAGHIPLFISGFAAAGSGLSPGIENPHREERATDPMEAFCRNSLLVFIR